MTQVGKKQSKGRESRKSSSLISSSSSSSSESQSKYQKKQLQLSKNTKNDIQPDKKTAKKNNRYSSRSRSHSSPSQNRSRSNRKQQKHRAKNSYRDRSRSKSHKKDKYKYDKQRDRNKSLKYRDSRDMYRNDRNDRNNRHKRDFKDRKYDDRKDRQDRGRSREKQKKEKPEQQKLLPTQIPMPLQVPMPLVPGQRRRRQRSKSPLAYYRKNQSNNEGQFWDSFSWVPRINYTPNVSSSALVNTKKMRRLMITNIPYEMGIQKDDLRDLITRFMTQNYLKDQMNNCPVRQLQINQEDHSVAVQLSSVEQTCRMCKLEKIQLFKGTINGIIRLGDSCYGNNIVTQAQNAAQAQAAAFAAITVLQNKKTNFNMDVNLNKGMEASTLIRITNAVTPYMASHLTPQAWEQYHEDLIEGFSQYGKVVHEWFVKADQKDICADAGNLFIEYETQEQATKAMSQMQGRIYDERAIKLFYIPRQIYYPNYKKELTPPVIKAPPKVKKENVYANLPQISKSSHIASKSGQ